MGHSSSRVHSSSLNDGQGSTTTPTNTQPTNAREYARNAQPSHNERESFEDTASGRRILSIWDADSANRQSQVEMRAAELDEILVYVNLKGQMVVDPYVISCEMLQRFEEKYVAGDCLHLAKLYHRHNDVEAFVDYMMKVADYKDRPKALWGYKYPKYAFASYYIGWDAQKNEGFRKLGPCVGDHVVLHGATREQLLTQAEFEFMRRADFSPKVDDKMIIDRHYKGEVHVDYPFTLPSPSQESWNAIITYLLEPSDDDEKTFYSLQTLARLREAVDDPTQDSPPKVSIKCSGGKDCPASAVWISMSHEERAKHTEEMKSWLAAEKAHEDQLRWKRNRHYGKASEPRGESSILSFGQDHSSHMLNSRKRDA